MKTFACLFVLFMDWNICWELNCKGVVHILRNQPRGGGGGFQMLTVDYGGGGGGLVVDYVIKIFIFYQFS